MQARLASANSTILALEEKVREMSHHDETLVDTIKRVRENAEVELKRYQEESEERHNRCASDVTTEETTSACTCTVIGGCHVSDT